MEEGEDGSKAWTYFLGALPRNFLPSVRFCDRALGLVYRELATARITRAKGVWLRCWEHRTVIGSVWKVSFNERIRMKERFRLCMDRPQSSVSTSGAHVEE